jgi:hypothetical protein
MFYYFAKRKLKKWGYVYLDKYKIWYQHEFQFYVTNKWIREFPILVNDFCSPFYQPKNKVYWKSRPDDTEFTPELAKEIKNYYEETILKKPKLLQVIVFNKKSK